MFIPVGSMALRFRYVSLYLILNQCYVYSGLLLLFSDARLELAQKQQISIS